MKRIAASLGIVLLSFNMAVAHGGRLHVMGKVMSLDADHVVVKTRAGDTVSILLNDHTAYWKGKDKARLSDGRTSRK